VGDEQRWILDTVLPWLVGSHAIWFSQLSARTFCTVQREWSSRQVGVYSDVRRPAINVLNCLTFERRERDLVQTQRGRIHRLGFTPAPTTARVRARRCVVLSSHVTSSTDARRSPRDQNMVASPEYRHVPTGTLAILARRLGTVSASPSTWYGLVRKYGWRRPSRDRGD
jgi:hypothetical protein